MMTTTETTQVLNRLLGLTQDEALALATGISKEDQQAANDLSDTYHGPVIMPGVYADEDTFYRVKWNQSKTNLYALVITPTGHGIRFGAYISGLMRKLRQKDMLTLAQCEALSLAWGNCVMCGKGLTVTKSVKRGMGPVCAKGYGKP